MPRAWQRRLVALASLAAFLCANVAGTAACGHASCPADTHHEHACSTGHGLPCHGTARASAGPHRHDERFAVCEFCGLHCENGCPGRASGDRPASHESHDQPACPCPGGCASCCVAKTLGLTAAAAVGPLARCPERSPAEAFLLLPPPYHGQLIRPPRA